jgi:hypothetical protein
MANETNAVIHNFKGEEVVSLKWTTEKGEEVIGVFGLVGWIKAPLVQQHDVVERQKLTLRGRKIISPGFVDPRHK